MQIIRANMGQAGKIGLVRIDSESAGNNIGASLAFSNFAESDKFIRNTRTALS
jgi:hypothetical protein